MKTITTHLLFLCCFSLFIICVNAQKLDSIEQVFKAKTLSVEEKIKLCDVLSSGYLVKDFSKSSDYARKGITLAEKSNDVKMQAILYCTLGESYDMVNKYDSTSIYLNKAQKLAIQVNDQKLQTKIYISIGNSYKRQNLHLKALDYYFKSLSIVENEGDKTTASNLLANIAGVHYALDNTDRALYYYSKAENTAIEVNNTIALSSVYYGFSCIYCENKKYDTALLYALKADKTFQSLGNLYNQSTNLKNISRIYRQLKDYAKSEEYGKKSIKMAENLGATNLLAWNMKGLALVYIDEKKYSEAEALAQKALMTDSTDMVLNKELFRAIFLANAGMGKKDDAIKNFTHFYDILIKYSNSNYQKSVSEMEVKYEADKQTLEISSLEKERRMGIWLSVVVAVLLLSILLTIFFRYRFVRQKVVRLEKEKQLVITQSILDGEIAERTRLSRDLHDGLGGMLSVVKFNLSSLKNGASLTGEDVGHFNIVLTTLDESIQELRRVAHNMMPDSLARYGLKVSLTDFCNSISIAEFYYYGSGDRLDPKLEVMIYRIVHELVNNALKHANADLVLVQIVQETDRIALTVQDDGCGFDATAETFGTGLNNIRNRVGSYNGRMEIWSKPGEGTEISVDFKLK